MCNVMRISLDCTRRTFTMQGIRPTKIPNAALMAVICRIQQNEDMPAGNRAATRQ